MLLGVDVGGTFTDFALLRDGQLVTYKLPTTVHDQALAFLAGVRDLQVAPGSRVVHGSTVATNALLERKGAVTALITTKGFGDVLEIARQNRPQLYALVGQRPPPLVPAALRYEIDERVAADGSVLRALDPASLASIIADMEARGVEAVAVCLLFSFLHPAHEQRVGQALGNRFFVSLSSDILPEYREYERTSTTAINAYVAPRLSRYLGHLSAELGRLGMSDLYLMQSSGGITDVEAAGATPARLVLSGPAAGVRGAYHIARLAGFSQIITFDMGGTSTDVALLPGRIQETAESTVAGLPLRLPMIDIHTVGAGGGSLARLDSGGALRVGPQSAGAEPGPVCYGRGGTAPTVTDANLVLGRLSAGDFLGGRMSLDVAAAHRVLTALGEALHGDAVTAARGIVRVANAVMERAIRTISVERGHDPRRFTLVAFGGAGPLHACELAEALGIRRVLVPRYPGILCALGLLVADLSQDLSRSALQPLGQAASQQLAQSFLSLLDDATAAMLRRVPLSRISLAAALDMRYLGQSFELTVPVGRVAARTLFGLGSSVAQRAARLEAMLAPSILATRFHNLHRRRYGHASPGEAVEVVNVRVKAVGRTNKPLWHAEALQGPDAAVALVRRELVAFADSEPVATPIYQRALLQPGNRIVGPAIVVQMDATTSVPPGWHAEVDRYGNLIIMPE